MVRSSADGALVLSKTTPLVNVSAGQSVPYTITAKNPRNTPIVRRHAHGSDAAGLQLSPGSGSINGKRLDPTVNGRELTWSRLSFAPGETKTFTLVLTIGSRRRRRATTSIKRRPTTGSRISLISNVASATVRIVGDPTFDCPDLIGKVFDDANANGVQDAGEKGIAGVRLVTAQGLLVTTDAQGRYHIACPVIPNADSPASNFVVKVDERTLPSGYRLTTDNPETVRLTAGKVSKLNFGATIHHVVRIEVNAAAYEGSALRAAVTERLDALVESLKDQASIVRLAYEAANESDALVDERMQVLKSAVTALWKAKDCRFPLRMEEDIVRGSRTLLMPRERVREHPQAPCGAAPPCRLAVLLCIALPCSGWTQSPRSRQVPAAGCRHPCLHAGTRRRCAAEYRARAARCPSLRCAGQALGRSGRGGARSNRPSKTLQLIDSTQQANFASGSDQLTADARAKLDVFAAALRGTHPRACW